MAKIEKTLKVSPKGQITLPKAIRERLKGKIVKIVADECGIRLEPVEDVAGSLKRYAKAYRPLEEIREQAWEAALREKYGRR